MNTDLVKKLTETVLSKHAELEETDTYYACMALSHPNLKPFLTAELQEVLQRKAIEYLGAFDLMQLAQVMGVFAFTATEAFIQEYEKQVAQAI